MKKTFLVGGALCLGALCYPSVSSGITAAGLSSFEGREEPSVIYYPSTGTFATGDTHPNMTDQGDATVRFELRYRSGQWWDGDRTTSNRDRQRAEVKGLGAHQKPGETFDYISNWRTNPEFVGTGKFCHFFQLKATDGDNGAPLVVASIQSGQSNAAVRFWPGYADTFIVARPFNWAPATWQKLQIRITTSLVGSNTGKVVASVNDDALQGVTDVQVYRPDSTDYRPKWGLYRGVSDGQAIGDDYVEHRSVTVNKIDDGGPPSPNLKFEAENLALTAYGATTALQYDSKNSGGVWVGLMADGIGDSVEYTLPNIPAGTYDFVMKYKAHPSRGILSLDVDGVQLVDWLDQYSAKQTYPETNFGVLRFSEAGDHVVRLTVVGKNPLSKLYTLSADRFTLIPDKTPPAITVPDDITAEATGPGGAIVDFATSATDDKDGDVAVLAIPPTGHVFPLGTTTVQLSAVDFAGNKATDSFDITVQDTTAPAIEVLAATPDSLWPPNHKMVAVSLSAQVGDVVDLAPLTRIVGVASNEPENGIGDGDTAPDWAITGPLTLDLRSERSGPGQGRVYTITVECRDASGNASTKTVTVTVPKSRGKGQ